MIGDIKIYSLNLRKYSQLDKQLFFDFYGVSLLSDQYLEANPYAKQYKDMIVQQVKDEYVPLITKMVYAELSKHTIQLFDWEDLRRQFNVKSPKDLTLKQLAEVYYEGNWEEKYGGSSWGNIVDSLIEIINTFDTNQLIKIIDTINSIEHNTGLIFHDFPKVKKWFSDALDIKFNATPEQLIPYLSSDLQKMVTEDLQLKGKKIEEDQEYIPSSKRPVGKAVTNLVISFSDNMEKLMDEGYDEIEAYQISLDKFWHTGYVDQDFFKDYIISELKSRNIEVPELKKLKISSVIEISSLSMRKKSYIMYNDKGQEFKIII